MLGRPAPKRTGHSRVGRQGQFESLKLFRFFQFMTLHMIHDPVIGHTVRRVTWTQNCFPALLQLSTAQHAADQGAPSYDPR